MSDILQGAQETYFACRGKVEAKALVLFGE